MPKLSDMTSILTGILYWIAFGMMVFMVVNILEAILLSMRGPGLRHWINKTLEVPEANRKPRPKYIFAYIVTGAIILWPIILIIYCKAAWRKKTFWEFVVGWVEQKNEELEEKEAAHKIRMAALEAQSAALDAQLGAQKQRLEDMNAGRVPTMASWEDYAIKHEDGTPGVLRVHLRAFLVEGVVRVLPSHVIGEGTTPEGVPLQVIWRVVGNEPRLSEQPPDGAFRDLKEAREACEKDTEWLALCLLDNEEKQTEWLASVHTPLVPGQVGVPTPRP